MRSQTFRHRACRVVCRRRAGAAAVELALVSPLLIVIVLGAIDVGQFVNVGQVVSNASRQGARSASRKSAANVSDVETVVQNYLAGAFPNVPASDIAGGVQVDVRDSAGNAIAGGDLTTLASGSAVSVRVALEFDPVRWMRGVDYLSGQAIETTTVMRRE